MNSRLQFVTALSENEVLALRLQVPLILEDFHGLGAERHRERSVGLLDLQFGSCVVFSVHRPHLFHSHLFHLCPLEHQHVPPPCSQPLCKQDFMAALWRCSSNSHRQSAPFHLLNKSYCKAQITSQKVRPSLVWKT